MAKLTSRIIMTKMVSKIESKMMSKMTMAKTVSKCTLVVGIGKIFSVMDVSIALDATGVSKMMSRT